MFPSLLFSGRDCVQLVLILLKSLIEFCSKGIWAWRFLLGNFLITNLIYLRYKTVHIIYFRLSWVLTICIFQIGPFHVSCKFLCVDLFIVLSFWCLQGPYPCFGYHFWQWSFLSSFFLCHSIKFIDTFKELVLLFHWSSLFLFSILLISTLTFVSFLLPALGLFCSSFSRFMR